MQEWLIAFLDQYSSFAPLIVFIALVIAAFNIPISEDLTVIAAGILVATLAKEKQGIMHLALLGGAIGGDMISYTLGRKIGRPLLQKRAFRKVLPPKKLERLSMHFAKHATLTILVGRLIPFGVRNAISLWAGITRLPAWKYLLLDGMAGAVNISIIYWLSKRYGLALFRDIRTVQFILLLIFLSVIIYLFIRFRARRAKEKHQEE